MLHENFMLTVLKLSNASGNFSVIYFVKNKVLQNTLKKFSLQKHAGTLFVLT